MHELVVPARPGRLGCTLAARLVAFARLHPVAVAAVVGAAVLAGPQRLVRWATLVMPLVMRMRRG